MRYAIECRMEAKVIYYIDVGAFNFFKIKSQANLFHIWIWLILSLKYIFGQFYVHNLKRKKDFKLIEDHDIS